MSLSKSCIVLDEHDTLFAKGKLLEHSEEQTVVELEPKYHSTAFFQMDHIVCVRTHDPSEGLTSCKGKVFRLDENRLYLRDCIIETHVEQRQDIKIPVGREAYFVVCGKDARPAAKFKVTLRDISAGGIGISTKHPLNFDDSYEIVFDLGREPDALPVEMIYKGQESDGKTLYGFRYAGLHPAQESQVREYVFKKHLEMVSAV